MGVKLSPGGEILFAPPFFTGKLGTTYKGFLIRALLGFFLVQHTEKGKYTKRL
jgi:hypothetical protein